MTRTLIVGAGATGGALGARLIIAEQDVTFLVRERRAAQLVADGLRFRAPDVDGMHTARAVTALDGIDPFDLVIIAVKAPVLEAIVPTLVPGIGPETCVVPLLNGMAHIDLLERAFPGRVLGGIVKIVATLDDDATVVQMTPLCSLAVGGLHGEAVPVEIRRTLDVNGIALEVVDDIAARLWEKWTFIAAGGEAQILQAIAECEQIAEAAGHPVSAAGHAQSLGLLTESGSAFTSSLYRDLQHDDPVEAEHIFGDLANRAAALQVPAALLNAALLQLRTHHQALMGPMGAAS